MHFCSAAVGCPQASCEKHDENILIVSGDKRTADIYVTEFMRRGAPFASKT